MATDRSPRARRELKMRWKFERNSPEYVNQKHMIFDDRRTKRQRDRTSQERVAIEESIDSQINQYEMDRIEEQLYWEEYQKQLKKY